MYFDAMRLDLFKFSCLSPEHKGALVTFFEDIAIVLIAGRVTDATTSPHVDGSFILHQVTFIALSLVCIQLFRLVSRQVVEVHIVFLAKENLVIQLAHEVLTLHFH